MAKIKEESLRLNIIINGDKARKDIADTEKGLDVLLKAQKRLVDMRKRLENSGRTETKQYQDLEVAIRDNALQVEEYRRKLENLRKGMPLTSMTMGDLRKHIAQVRVALSKAVPGTENFKKLSAELTQAKARMAELNQTTKATRSILGTQIEGWGDLWAVIHSGFSTVTRLWSLVTRTTDAYMEYDEALTDAMKTTNLTKEEVTALSDELAKIDTRTAQTELLALLRIGGKLGVEGEENLLGFVRAADKINVALKEDLGGDAEAAIAQIGKLVDIFQLEEQYGLEGSMIRTGSAINSLGMASTANEGYIVDFTRRLAGVAPNADISITSILGMAATLDKYGQQVETAGTAIGQTITAMFKRTDTFAEIANMSVQEFTDLLNNDVNEALIRVLEGMKGADGTLHSVVAAMDEMHLNGQRAVQILGTLSKNTDELRQQQDLANESFLAGTSLLEEFETKNESATATLEKQKKAIQEEVVEIGQQLMPVVNEVMDLADLGLKVIRGLVTISIKYRGVIIALTAAKLADVAASKLQNFWSDKNRASLAEEVKDLKGATASTIAASAAKNLLAGNIKAAASAFKLMFNAIKTGMGPLGWIIAAFGLLAAAMKPLINRWKEQRELMKELERSNQQISESYSEVASQIDRERRNTEQLLSAVRKAKSGSTERAAAIKEINKQYKSYLPALLTEKSSNEDVATALASVNTQLENKIRLQAKEQELTRIASQVNDQTKKTITGFVTVLEKSIGKETSSAMRAEMTQAVLEYKNAISDASLSPAEQKKLRTKLFGTFFDLGGNQLGFRGNTLRGLLDGLDAVMKSASRANEMLDQMYGNPTAPSSGITVDDDPSDTTPTGGDDDSKWSLAKDRQFLEARLKLKKEYYNNEIATEEDLQSRILQLEIDTISKRLATATLDAEERVALEEDLQDRLLQQKESAAKKEEKIQQEVKDMTAELQTDIKTIRDNAIEEENRRYESLKKEYAGNASALEALERQHQHKISKIQLDYVNGQISEAAALHDRKVAELKNEHQEELAVTKATGRALKRIKEDQAAELAAIDLEYATELQNILDSVLNLEGKIDISLAGLTPEELETVRKKLEEIRALRNSMDGTAPTDTTGSQTQGMTQQASFWGLDQDQWTAMFDSGVDGWTRMGLAATAFGEAAQEAMNIVALAMDRQARLEEQQLKEYKKEQDEKRAVLEKRLDAGLMTESQYNAELQKMDEDYAEKEEELAMAQAKREKAMSLTQAIINTALGVTSTLAQWGVPWGLIPAGIMAAMGAAEIALIASTPVTTGYAKGGKMKVKRAQDGRVFDARLSPDARGFISSPTALVAEDGTEYVIPSEGVANPSLAPLLNTIESARRQGTLKDLSYESLYAPAMTGRAAGGFIADPGPADDVTVGSPRLLSLLEQILERLDQPVPAIVQMLGSKGLIEQLEKYYKNKKNGNING